MTSGKWTAVVAAAVIAGGLATAALAGDGARGARSGRHQRARQLLQRKRGRTMEFLRSLQITDQQRQTMLDKARAVAPIVETAKTDARKLIAQAWAQASKDATVDRRALRAGVKEQVKALRAKAWTQIEPLARDVVATLTPEQRQKFTEKAAKRGKTVDDAKLAKFMGRLISRPMAVPFLEARLGVSAPK